VLNGINQAERQPGKTKPWGKERVNTRGTEVRCGLRISALGRTTDGGKWKKKVTRNLLSRKYLLSRPVGGGTEKKKSMTDGSLQKVRNMEKSGKGANIRRKYSTWELGWGTP